jgi:excisionase family DNA binding protein
MNMPVRDVVTPDIEPRRRHGANWRAASVCREHPTDWWFNGGHRETMLAKGICEGCPVRVECLEFALGRPELIGVWAATTPTERASMRRAGDGIAVGARPEAPVEPGLRRLVDVDLVLEEERADAPEPQARAEREPEAQPGPGPAPHPHLVGAPAPAQAREPEPEPEGDLGRRRAGGFAGRRELLTPAEAARLLGVTPNTVTRWSRAGKVSAIQTMGGHRRFRRSEIERVLRESNLPASTSI